MVLPKYAGKLAQVKGVEEAMRLLNEFIAENPKITEKNFRELGKNMVAAASSRTPINTGRLVSNNKIFAVDSKKLVVGNPTPYAGFVEDGTSKKPARPFWRPVINTVGSKYPSMVIKDYRAFYQALLRKHKPKQ